VNFIDIAVLVVIGFSALIAVSRGFIKELLSILGWIGAVVATILLFPYARPVVRTYIAEPLLADIAAGVGIFVITIVLCGILNQMISSRIRGGSMGAVDRTLGLVFGLARGAAIVCAAYILLAWGIKDRAEWPAVVVEARTLPLVESGAGYLQSLLPPGMRELGETTLDQGVKAIEQGQELNQQYQDLNQGGQSGADAGTHGSPASEAANPGGQAAGTGYNDAERNDLNRMIQTTQ
jgi:membrane protein required for colicin V production